MVGLRCSMRRMPPRRCATPAIVREPSVASTIVSSSRLPQGAFAAAPGGFWWPRRRSARETAAPPLAGLAAHEAFEFALGPGDGPLHGFALQDTDHHLGHDRLGVDL